MVKLMTRLQGAKTQALIVNDIRDAADEIERMSLHPELT
jgi:hypothetical protein